MPVGDEITHREVSNGELCEIINSPRQNRVAAHTAICKIIADCTGSKEASYVDIKQNRRYEFIARLMRVDDTPLQTAISRLVDSLSPVQRDLFERIRTTVRRLGQGEKLVAD